MLTVEEVVSLVHDEVQRGLDAVEDRRAETDRDLFATVTGVEIEVPASVVLDEDADRGVTKRVETPDGLADRTLNLGVDLGEAGATLRFSFVPTAVDPRPAPAADGASAPDDEPVDPLARRIPDALTGYTPGEVARLERAGVVSVADLAGADPRTVRDATNLSMGEARRAVDAATFVGMGAAPPVAEAMTAAGFRPDRLGGTDPVEVLEAVDAAVEAGRVSLPDDALDYGEVSRVVARARERAEADDGRNGGDGR